MIRDHPIGADAAARIINPSSITLEEEKVHLSLIFLFSPHGKIQRENVCLHTGKDFVIFIIVILFGNLSVFL